MEDFDSDPLDLIDDGDQGAIELSLLEEEKEKQSKEGAGKNSTGCCVVLFLIGSSVILAGWIVNQIL